MDLVLINPTLLRQRPNYKSDEREIILLVDSVQKSGQVLPITVTKDLVIIKGARLRDACFRAGKVQVKCVVIDITYLDWVKGSYEHM